MIGIYKITSPTGKIYIGQSINIDSRWNRYRKYHCKGQVRLHNSLLKYGSSSHIFEVVEQCQENLLNDRERHWQDFYSVMTNKGLNCKLTKSKDKSGQHSEETKAKQSKALKGIPIGPKPLHIRDAMKVPREKVTCPHCGKHGGVNRMKQVHFDKCKQLTGEVVKKSPRLQQTRDKISQTNISLGIKPPSQKGTTKTDQHKEAIRQALLGGLKEVVTCPHCKKQGGQNAMKRWHFSNCKYK